MDIREKIYTEIAERKGIGYPEDEEVAKRLSEADTQLLVQDMDQFYRTWFDIQQLQREKFDKERCDLEYIQESSFEIACQALALKGNPNIIPCFFKYVSKDDWDWNVEVNMEDYNEQNLERCIVGAEYYGEAYIPVLLAHIHELVPDKMLKADNFLYKMLLDDLNYFEETHPLFHNLHVVEKKIFMKLLDFSLERTIDETRREDLEKSKLLEEQIHHPIQKIIFDDDPLIQVAYLRQEFLKLHAAD